MRTANHDRASLKIDVTLLQREQLALAKSGVDRCRKHRSPMRGERCEHRWHFVGTQIVGFPFQHATAASFGSGVWRDEVSKTLGVVVGRQYKATQMVHRLR